MGDQRKSNKSPRYLKVEISIALSVFVLYTVAIFLPVVFLQLRINSIDGLRGGDYYAFENYIDDGTVSTSTMKDFYNYLYDSDNESQTMFSYLSSVDEISGISFRQNYATESFFEWYDFELYDGRVFESADFSHEGNNVIPIIVGYNIKELYKIGETYDIDTFGSADRITVMVVGILEKGANYIAHWLERITLDNACIIPISRDLSDSHFGYSDLHMFFSRAVIKSTNPTAISNKINEMDLPLHLVPADNAMTQRMGRFVNTFIERLSVGSIIFAVALFLIFLQMQFFIRRKL